MDCKRMPLSRANEEDDERLAATHIPDNPILSANGTYTSGSTTNLRD